MKATVSRILVPVDFSECSRAALEFAVALAGHMGAIVDVLHVWESPYPIGYGMEATLLSQFSQAQAGTELEEFLAAIDDHSGPPGTIHSHLETGIPSETILKVAENDQYDLIVMGTHGRTGKHYWLVGSLAAELVRRAPCPVLTIRPPRRLAKSARGKSNHLRMRRDKAEHEAMITAQGGGV